MNEAAQAGAAPAWFQDAIAKTPEVATIQVAGADIELLTWGERGRPGVLLMHGNWAHARWWRHIAPFLAEDYRVAAFSWSGMGGSGWRERYTTGLFVDEAFAAAKAAGLYDGAQKPVFIGHSFGGDLAWACAADPRAEGLRVVVTLDSVARDKDDRPPPLKGPLRTYQTLDAAVPSFRLARTSPASQPYIIDMIARGAFRQMDGLGPDGGPAWALSFDRELWTKYEREESREHIDRALCPLVAIWTDQTMGAPDGLAKRTRGWLPPGTPSFVIPASGHHIMVDQPIALVASLRSILALGPPNLTPPA